MEIPKSCSSHFFNLSGTSISQNFPNSRKPPDKLLGSGDHNSLPISKIRFKVIFGPKIGKLPRTYFGSFHSKQIHKINPLLSAHQCHPEVLPPKRGLDGEDRSERRLASRPNQRRVPAFHVHVQGTNYLSVCAWPQQFSRV